MSTENNLPPTELIEGHPDNVLIKGGGCWNCGEHPALLVADEDDYRQLFEFAERTWEQLQKAEGAGEPPPRNSRPVPEVRGVADDR